MVFLSLNRSIKYQMNMTSW